MLLHHPLPLVITLLLLLLLLLRLGAKAGMRGCRRGSTDICGYLFQGQQQKVDWLAQHINQCHQGVSHFFLQALLCSGTACHLC